LLGLFTKIKKPYYGKLFLLFASNDMTFDPVLFTEYLVDLQQRRIEIWQDEPFDTAKERDIGQLIEENHAYNYLLWRAEDKARRDDLGFEHVYHAKRQIDAYNQARNNRMEAMDAWLWQRLSPSLLPDCPVHSETPGMIIDRLSILALKVYHMRLQTIRQDVEAPHITRCLAKLRQLTAQQQQLQHNLAQLLTEVMAQTRTFKVYHQCKMYNDKTLNPELYASS